MSKIQRRQSKNNGLKALWTGIMTIVVMLLLFLTVGIVALRIGNTLPEGVDIILMVPKNPEFSVGDEAGGWETSTKVDIFSSSYENGELQTTVLSQNGDNIIAPGTVSTYKFCMYNEGNMAIEYDLSFAFELKIDGADANAQAFPLQIRVMRTDGKYVVGEADKWVNLTAGKLGSYSGIVGASSYEEFTLELMWAFEGNDALDTALGNVSVRLPVNLDFKIDSYAVESETPDLKGGVFVSEGLENGEEYEYGGTIRWELFLPIVIALIVAGMYLVLWRL